MTSDEITKILTQNSGVGRRFSSASLENFNPINEPAKQALNACEQFVSEWGGVTESGSNMLLLGRPGTGKTHLSVAVMRALIERYDADVYLTTAQRIIRAMRDSWRQNSERTEYDVLGFYCDQDLLVIDEIGMQHGTDSERLLVSEVINTRYEQMLPCILVSNYTREELDTFLGYRAMDRVMESAAVIPFAWDSYRTGNHG
ncbi:ATP-binding protein [Pectobacterium carotovorum]|uniref:ATP-binding protein n=1 Tax=Pectobacterium carotovorum TaxID=554 RepID=UPI00191D19D3|nr:ATP-binding protein [Pectobacterium carotovorum]MBL0907838.1 ATP-binding protein [Pectobacterium carotovorum]